MTEAPVTTRRRCSQCGRFLAAGSTEKLCTLCIDAGANGSAPEPSAISVRQAAEPPPPFEQALQPGVIIPRPSQLHPDEEHPVAKRLPPVRPAVVTIAPPPLPAPAPAKAARTPKPPKPARVRQAERVDTDVIRERRVVSVAWIPRLIVGLAIGLLVGIAVPLLLSR
ncbi:MAG TPA: hypothetical protein VI277_05375 [Candidatus Limnocylindria bacterium]